MVGARFQALQLLGVTLLYRKKVMYATKSDGISNTREYGLAFSRTVQTEDITFQFDLRIYDNKKEPIDVIYQFVLPNSAIEHFDLMILLVLPHIFEVLPCQRLVPLVFTKVLRNKYMITLGRLEILRNKEPIDAINRFIRASGLASVCGDEASLYRYNVLQEVCEEVLCTRSTLVVYKKTISDSNGTALVLSKVFDFGEVVDVVVLFLTDTNAELDHIKLNHHLFQNLCVLP